MTTPDQPPTIVVYCEGPRRDQHRRVLVAEFERTVLSRTPVWGPTAASRRHILTHLFDDRPVDRPVIHQPDAGTRTKANFHCRACGFHEKHGALEVYVALTPIFEALYVADTTAVAVRDLFGLLR